MNYLGAFVGFLLAISLADAALVGRRSYRNTEEILVPVAIVQDGEEIKDTLNLEETEKLVQDKNLKSVVIAEDIPSDVDVGDLQSVVQAERRIDEAIIEDEIKEAVEEEQDKETTVKDLEEENILRTSIAEAPQKVDVALTENIEAAEEPAKELDQDVKASDYKAVVIEKQAPTKVVVIVEGSNQSADKEAAQPEEAVRQATQATPAQSTTQQNFVQQLIQNSPLGQFFNQITGQTTQNQANDDTAPAPGLFNPVTAVQNAAQTVVNSTTQAFQGLQQFASNLGNQFQSTLSSLGGQQPDQTASDVTTARPPGPIQQLVNTFIGTPQQAQPTPTQQGPLQGLLNIFQGNNNRPQGSTAGTNTPAQPAKQPEVQQPAQTADAEESGNAPNQITNEVRGSGESNDSFEDAVQPDEIIVVNDDTTPAVSDQLRENINVPK